MTASGTAARQRPHGGRRSLQSALTAMVAVPAAALILLWAAAMASLLAMAQSRRSFLHGHRELAAALLFGAGLVIVVIAVASVRLFAGRLSRDIRGLAEAAGAQAAVGSLRRAPASTGAATAAGDASPRDGDRQVLISLAGRNQPLLQRQLRLIDALEEKAADPAALADLFALDHLATRMRRHAESLAVLSGAAAGRSFRDPIPVIDVIRGAMAETEDYRRVVTPTVADDAVIGPAATDMMHLLAELIENATLYSPPGTQVEVRAGLAAHGLAVEIEDQGPGIEPGPLDQLNQRLASPPGSDPVSSGRLGLFVAGKLAARHGTSVSLRSSPGGGTIAIVLMPASIIVPAGGSLSAAPEDARTAPAAPAGPAITAAPAAAGIPADRAAPDAGPVPAADRRLPQRSRQAWPHLPDSGPAPDQPGTGTVGPAAISPERARSFAAAWQSGWQRNRQPELASEHQPAGASPAGASPAGQADHGLRRPDAAPGEMSRGERG